MFNSRTKKIDPEPVLPLKDPMFYPPYASIRLFGQVQAFTELQRS